MRTVLALTFALALCGPMAAFAAGTSQAEGVSQVLGAFHQVKSVRVIEKFESGALATVDVIPSGQFRIASTGGQDPALIMRIATQPMGEAASTPGYTISSAGTKTIDGAKTTGYHIVAPDGTYDAILWVNSEDLPVTSHVNMPGHSIDVTYGDYNDSSLVGKP